MSAAREEMERLAGWLTSDGDYLRQKAEECPSGSELQMKPVIADRLGALLLTAAAALRAQVASS